MIAGNIRVSKGLTRACREDIRKYHCRRLVSDDKDVRLAQLLLCLENAIHNGKCNKIKVLNFLIKTNHFQEVKYLLIVNLN